jgi:hypothetical protein
MKKDNYKVEFSGRGNLMWQALEELKTFFSASAFKL